MPAADSRRHALTASTFLHPVGRRALRADHTLFSERPPCEVRSETPASRDTIARDDQASAAFSVAPLYWHSLPRLRRGSLPGCPVVESPWHRACASAERADNLSARRHLVSGGHHVGDEELG